MRRRHFPWALLGTLVVIALAVTLGLLLTKQKKVDDAGAVVNPPPPVSPSVAPSVTVAFIGDGWTFGTGASAQSKRFSSLVAAHEHWAETNFGVTGTGYQVKGTGKAGNNFNDRIVRVEHNLASPNVIVVSGGIIDEQHSTGAKTIAAINTFYPALRAAFPKAHIVAISPFWTSSKVPFTLSGPMRNAVKAQAAKIGATYIDLTGLMQNHSSWITASGINVGYPNDAGYAAIATAIEFKVEALPKGNTTLTPSTTPTPSGAPSSSPASGSSSSTGSSGSAGSFSPAGSSSSSG